MIIYLVRHSGPFVEYENEQNLTWDEFNANMTLSCAGEEKAKKLLNVKEFELIKNIYSSLSSRAIATAKYVAENNKIKIKLDKRIDELKLGIKYLREIPNNFHLNQFKDRNYKLKNGESLNEVSLRFNSFISDLIKQNEDCILFVHGMLLLNFLSENSNFTFDGRVAKVVFNNKVVIDRKLNNPDVFKLTFADGKLVNLENILL